LELFIARFISGLLNGAGAGKTGKILLVTVTAVANVAYAVTLWLRKTTQ
jgi:hypothetical protein